MAATKNMLAFDLGAESGRAILGRFDGERLGLEVLHRFPNGPVRTLDTLHWDVLRLYAEMLAGLRKCVAEKGPPDSLGVDTWGVDFGLLGKDGTLLGNPRHYRDPHTEGVMEEAFRRVPADDLFFRTGIQFMRFNTLFQLLALRRDKSPLLDVADALLFMPDLFHYFFTGQKANEYTNATTSQMIDAEGRTWARGLVEQFGLPGNILGNLVQPGTVLGVITPAVRNETGAPELPVVLPATHDTASAVAAVPARGESWAYISSGTWSLMGAETTAPLTGPEVRAVNFTNEGGYGGTTRFLKNIMGLWLVQECRRAWERAGPGYSYDDLARLAAAAPPFAALVNPDDASFLLPPSMPEAIAEACARTGQAPPREPGSVVRCCLESLALRYRWVLDRLEGLLGKRLDVVHVVGGGSKNALLCQFTADACNRPVLAGPDEATAIGNVLVQAIGLGAIGSLPQAREVVRRSFDVRTYEPKDAGAWEEPYQRFLGVLARGG